MEMDIPLTDLFWCPYCGFREMLKAESVAYLRCICGNFWVIGDYEIYLSFNEEERENLKTYYIDFIKDKKDWNQEFLGIEAFYS